LKHWQNLKNNIPWEETLLDGSGVTKASGLLSKAAFKSFSLQVRYHSGLVHIVKPMCMANRNQSEN
jgi:hypothetical protein